MKDEIKDYGQDGQFQEKWGMPVSLGNSTFGTEAPVSSDQPSWTPSSFCTGTWKGLYSCEIFRGVKEVLKVRFAGDFGLEWSEDSEDKDIKLTVCPE